MKKKYIKPESTTYNIEPHNIIAFSGLNNGKGEHKGWDNPHNPHYNGNNSSEYRNTLWDN